MTEVDDSRRVVWWWFVVANNRDVSTNYVRSSFHNSIGLQTILGDIRVIFPSFLPSLVVPFSEQLFSNLIIPSTLSNLDWTPCVQDTATKGKVDGYESGQNIINRNTSYSTTVFY
jgi:hypothetical protein